MFYNNQALITEWVNNLSAFFPVTAPHAKTVIKFWHLLVTNQKECFGGKKIYGTKNEMSTLWALFGCLHNY